MGDRKAAVCDWPVMADDSHVQHCFTSPDTPSVELKVPLTNLDVEELRVRGAAFVRPEEERPQRGSTFASSPMPRQSDGRGHRRGLDGPSTPT